MWIGMLEMSRSSSLGVVYDDVFGGFLSGVSLFSNNVVFGDLLGEFNVFRLRL